VDGGDGDIDTEGTVDGGDGVDTGGEGGSTEKDEGTVPEGGKEGTLHGGGERGIVTERGEDSVIEVKEG